MRVFITDPPKGRTRAVLRESDEDEEWEEMKVLPFAEGRRIAVVEESAVEIHGTDIARWRPRGGKKPAKKKRAKR
jgi:hypothetical protein